MDKRPHREYDVRELMTAHGAAELAKELEAFWKERGYPGIRCWVQKFTDAHVTYGHGIRSNLLNGIPPK